MPLPAKLSPAIPAACLLLLLVAPSRGAGKAAAFRAVVDRKGMLNVPAAVLKKMGVKETSSGLIAVQFPVSVLRKPPPKQPGEAHEHSAPTPPRVWTSLRRDGSLVLGKTRLIPGPEEVPGPPGTVYLATGEKGKLILRKPGKQ